MKKFDKLFFLTVAFFCLTGGLAFAQAPVSAGTDTVVVFSFQPGKDGFMRKGNETALECLYELIDRHQAGITGREIPVYVDGYCASMPTVKENLNMAFIRANRVKSELITHKGLEEDHFITKNYATDYNGRKDRVVVTLRIPAATGKNKSADEEMYDDDGELWQIVRRGPRPEPGTSQADSVQDKEQPAAAIREGMAAKPYCFAVRTNVLYDAFLLPTLGVEWRVNPSLGVKLDGSLAWWSGENNRVQKMWMLNPEVRWYLLDNRRFYVGASGNYGEYNLYRYMLGNLFSHNTGYQGNLWGAGLVVGYQLPLAQGFSLDFGLGLGYTRFVYDSFGITNGVRVYKQRDKSKNFWGPTQAGISLVWSFGGNK